MLHSCTAGVRWLLLPTADDGAVASVYAACATEVEGVSGAYYGHNRSRGQVEEVAASPSAVDPVLAAYVWEQSARLLNEGGIAE